MTERDVLTAVRMLTLLVQDANLTMGRLHECGYLTLPGVAIVLAWRERAAQALEDAEGMLR